MKDILGPRFSALVIDYLVVFTVITAYMRAGGQPTAEGGYEVTVMPGLFVPLFWLI